MRSVGVDLDVLSRCPIVDADHAAISGAIFIGSFVYQASLFSIIGEKLFASPGHIRFDVILGGLFLAGYITLVDTHTIAAPSWHQAGLSELKRGGLNLDQGWSTWLKIKGFLAVRIGLFSVAFALLTGIFGGQIIFDRDIAARLQQQFLESNGHLIPAATARVEAEIQRDADAFSAQTKQVETLATQVAALRQNAIDPSANNPEIQQAQGEVTRLVERKAKADEDVRKAEKFASDEGAGIIGAPGNTGKPGCRQRCRAAVEQAEQAKTYAAQIAAELDLARTRLDSLRQKLPPASDASKQAVHDQLEAYEKSLEAENTKLSNQKAELTNLTNGREGAIRRAIENAPDHVDVEGGLLTQIKVLEQLASEDPKIATIIILIEIISFALEAGAVLAKVTSYQPSTYAALIARDAYMTAVKIVDEMMVKLKRDDNSEGGVPEGVTPNNPVNNNQGGGAAATPEPSTNLDNPAQQPVKRKRGRPRKHPILTIVKDASGREGSGQGPDRPAPA
jgi:predicted  nucleic acid-binding Zn-ribbon protein